MANVLGSSGQGQIGWKAIDMIEDCNGEIRLAGRNHSSADSHHYGRNEITMSR